MIEGTDYEHGAEVQNDKHLRCPLICEVPSGLKLVQVVEPGTSFSFRCPHSDEGCGIALRMVETASQLEGRLRE